MSNKFYCDECEGLDICFDECRCDACMEERAQDYEDLRNDTYD